MFQFSVRLRDRFQFPRVRKGLIRSIAWLLMALLFEAFLLEAVGGNAFRRVDAQSPEETRSHRVLELPAESRLDIRSQIRMMLGLSERIDEENQTQTEAFVKDLDADQLQALAELLNLLPAQAPGGSTDLGELADQISQQPDLRRKAEDLLEQYARDRRLPPFGASGRQGIPWLPPSLAGGSGASSSSPPVDNFRTNGDQQGSTAASPQRPNRRPPGLSIDEDRGDLLGELARKWSNYQSRDGAFDFSRFLRDMQRDPSSLPDISGLTLPDGSLGFSSSRGASKIDSGTELREAPIGEGANQGARDAANAPTAERLREALGSLKQALPDKFQARLDRNGAARALKEMLRQSRQEVARGPANPTSRDLVAGDPVQSGASSGEPGASSPLSSWEATVLEAITDGATEIGSLVQGLKNSRPRSNAQPGQPGSTAKEPRGQQAAPKAMHSNKELDRASASSSQGPPTTQGFLSGLTGRSASKSDDEQPSETEADRASVMFVPVELIILCVLLLGLGIYFTIHYGRQPGTSVRVSAADPQALQIETRRDVVRAFHLLAQRSLEERNRWWTHERVAASLSARHPHWELALVRFAELYEQARYEPQHVELTEQQLRAAQRAWEHCRE